MHTGRLLGRHACQRGDERLVRFRAYPQAPPADTDRLVEPEQVPLDQVVEHVAVM